jgi:hypothetical protein
MPPADTLPVSDLCLNEASSACRFATSGVGIFVTPTSLIEKRSFLLAGLPPSRENIDQLQQFCDGTIDDGVDAWCIDKEERVLQRFLKLIIRALWMDRINQG